MAQAIISCGGGSSTPTKEETIQGLHIVAALYDEGDPTNIDDNVMNNTCNKFTIFIINAAQYYKR